MFHLSYMSYSHLRFYRALTHTQAADRNMGVEKRSETEYNGENGEAW